MDFKLFLPIIILAFICETVDSTLGMGYGTTLTPILLLMGYEPAAIVPAVLFSEFITGVLAGVLHHEFGNVDLRPGTRDFKIAAVMTALSMIGVVLAVLVTVSLPPRVIKFYIGFLVLGIGLVILLKRGQGVAFSWKRLAGLGTIASFNKGISGGGYGPLVTGGQVLAGVDTRSAVGITSIAEGVTSGVGLVVYLISGVPFPMELGPSLLLGAVLSVPIASYLVSRLSVRRITLAIGGLSTVLGSITLLRLLING